MTAAGFSLASAQTTITVHADHIVQPVNNFLTGVCLEDVNHEIYGGLYSQMIFGESFQEPPLPATAKLGQVSGMWEPLIRGNATGAFALDTRHPFVGSQSQRMTFLSDSGEVEIQNRGLNHWGMNLVQGRAYEGSIWVRADSPTSLSVKLQSKDGSRIYAEQSLSVPPGDWTKLDFTLTPSESNPDGAFAISLRRPGSVTIGYAFLQPGPWGRFKDLPVRKDVVQGLIDQGVRVMRYGGSMANSPQYRWKNMIGPPDRRPPYAGHWYPYSSNGWGIIDFLNLCEAMGIVAVPDVNVNESPQDLADFIEYVNGSTQTKWGQRRAADGHPEPYHLTHLEVGNEERVDDAYADKFIAIAQAIWQKDPSIILVVGDFRYSQKIIDPDHLIGADSGIQNLNAHRRILDFARRQNREVWFDVHIWSDGPQRPEDLTPLLSYVDTIDKIANGAKHKVVVFELNANSHGQYRALANAISINTIRRDNRIPIVTSANALQPDGQNDNGWDQGLLFLNPSQVWLQPPGYVLQMMSRNNLPELVHCDVDSQSHLDVTATRSTDGKTLVLQLVNPGDTESASISFPDFNPGKRTAHVTQLLGPANAANTAQKPDEVQPIDSEWNYQLIDGKILYSFPSQSFTILQFE